MYARSSSLPALVIAIVPSPAVAGRAIASYRFGILFGLPLRKKEEVEEEKEEEEEEEEKRKREKRGKKDLKEKRKDWSSRILNSALR